MLQVPESTLLCSFFGFRKLCLFQRPSKRTPPPPSQRTVRTIRDYTPWIGKRDGKYSPWKGKRSAGEKRGTYAPWIGKRSDSRYAPWTGKRSDEERTAHQDHRPKKFRPWAGKRSHGGTTILELSGSYTTSPMTPGRPSTRPMDRKTRSDSMASTHDPWTRVLINGLLRLHPDCSTCLASLIGPRDMESVYKC